MGILGADFGLNLGSFRQIMGFGSWVLGLGGHFGVWGGQGPVGLFGRFQGPESQATLMTKQKIYVRSRAGRSPTFQDPGTPLDGLAGTRVPASPMELVLSFKISPCLSRSAQ